VTLQAGWVTSRLAEAAQIIRGIAFEKGAKTGAPREGYVACLRTTNVQRAVEWSDLWFIPASLVKNPDKWLRRGDILISTANSHELVGKVAPLVDLPMPATLGAFISAIRPYSQHNPRFLYYQLASSRIQAQIRSMASTTTNISNVSTGKLADLVVALPPREQQDLIVSEIDRHFTRLDAGVASLRQADRNLTAYRSALVNRLLTGEAATLRATDVLPPGWEWVSVAGIAAEVVDCPHSTPKFQTTGFPCVDTTNIRPGRILSDRLRFVDEATFVARNRRLSPRAGDVVFAREGTVGTAVALPEAPSVCLGQRVMLIRPTNRILPKYLEQALMAPVVRRQYQGQLIGSTVAHVNVRDVRRFQLPLPPLEVQEQIVSTLDVAFTGADHLQWEISAALKRSKALRDSILRSALTGALLTDRAEVTSEVLS
jgi:type I restriction enzyme, S subunit